MKVRSRNHQMHHAFSLILIAAIAVFGSAVPAAVTKTEAAHARVANQAPVASKLAARVYAARTTKARYRALLSVMKALRVGVYTARGKAILQGAERGPKDFYLYDFQVAGMAVGLGRKLKEPIVVVADGLARLGVRSKGQPLSSQTLQSSLVSTVHTATAHPARPRSLAPLLMRQLGLHQRPSYDLSQNASESSIQLDPLQHFILMLGLAPRHAHKLAGAPRKLRGLTSRPNSELAARSTVRIQTASKNCTFMPSKPVPDVWWSVWDFLTIDNREEFQAGLLQMLVRPTQPEVSNFTHFGPAGHAPIAGKPLKYSFGMTSLANGENFIGKSPVQCGWLKGTQFPPSGNVSVRVDWKSIDTLKATGLFRSVEHHDRTDAKASLIATPRDEAVPGFGQVRTVSGKVEVNYYPFDAYPSLPPQLVQFRNLPLPVDLPDGHVERHAPRGFEFSGLKFTTKDIYFDGQDVDTFDNEISGHVCGETPYIYNPRPTGWILHLKQTKTYSGPGGNGEANPVESDSAPLTLIPGLNGTLTNNTEGTIFAIELVPGPPPQMRFTVTVPTDGRVQGHHYEPAVQTVSVPVTDDMSCPAPTP